MSAKRQGDNVFDGVRLGAPATRALEQEGYATLDDLPADLDELARLHGVGPRAIVRLRVAREGGSAGTMRSAAG